MMFKSWLFLIILAILTIYSMLLFPFILICRKVIDFIIDDDRSCIDYWIIYIDAYLDILRKIKKCIFNENVTLDR